MSQLISPELTNYFFGGQFDANMMNHTLSAYSELSALKEEIAHCNANFESHLGIRITNYVDVDSGLFMSALQTYPNQPSMVSFYASSSHRLFGGQTLICVPLQFCTTLFEPKGEYLVYRHTYKKPLYDEEEIRIHLNSGSDEERMRTYLFIRSREAFETIPGKSYVGITKRSWQARYREHVEKAMEKSGGTLLNQAIREMQGKRVIHVHDVSAFGITKEDAIQYEKELIKKSTLQPKGLNMKVG